jgi:hypothetical protein
MFKYLSIVLVLFITSCKFSLKNGIYSSGGYHPYVLTIENDSFSDCFYTSVGDYFGLGYYKIEDDIITFGYINPDTNRSSLTVEVYNQLTTDSVDLFITSFDKKTGMVLPFTSIIILSECGDTIIADYTKVEKELHIVTQAIKHSCILKAEFIGYRPLIDTIWLDKSQKLDINLSMKENFLMTDNGVIKKYEIIKSSKNKVKLCSLKSRKVTKLKRIK